MNLILYTQFWYSTTEVMLLWSHYNFLEVEPRWFRGSEPNSHFRGPWFKPRCRHNWSHWRRYTVFVFFQKTAIPWSFLVWNPRTNKNQHEDVTFLYQFGFSSLARVGQNQLIGRVTLWSTVDSKDLKIFKIIPSFDLNILC